MAPLYPVLSIFFLFSLELWKNKITNNKSNDYLVVHMCILSDAKITLGNKGLMAHILHFMDRIKIDFTNSQRQTWDILKCQLNMSLQLL